MRFSICAVAVAIPALTFAYPLEPQPGTLRVRDATNFVMKGHLPVARHRKRSGGGVPKCRIKSSNDREGQSHEQWKQWKGKHDSADSKVDMEATDSLHGVLSVAAANASGAHTPSLPASATLVWIDVPAWSEPAPEFNPPSSESASASSEPSPTLAEISASDAASTAPISLSSELVLGDSTVQASTSSSVEIEPTHLYFSWGFTSS